VTVRIMPTPLAVLAAGSACKTRVVPLWLWPMASITLKNIPMELHAQLKNEAAANFRSVTQEAINRLERTFQIDAALTTKRDQKWIDEAIASGPATALTKREVDAEKFS
jgi:plasmid stability protein